MKLSAIIVTLLVFLGATGLHLRPRHFRRLSSFQYREIRLAWFDRNLRSVHALQFRLTQTELIRLCVVKQPQTLEEEVDMYLLLEQVGRNTSYVFQNDTRQVLPSSCETHDPPVLYAIHRSFDEQPTDPTKLDCHTVRTKMEFSLLYLLFHWHLHQHRQILIFVILVAN